MSGNNLKKPKNKGIAKVPVVMQMEAMECGAASLRMILAYYGKWIDLATLRDDCGVSRDGQKLSKVVKTAEFYGLSYKAYRYRSETLYKEATFPCIVHWRGAHFVVVCGVTRNRVVVNDPALGRVIYTKEQFEANYTNMCVMFEPTEQFKPSGKKVEPVSYILQRLKKHKAAVIFMALTTILISSIHIMQPGLMRYYVDNLTFDQGGSNAKQVTWDIPGPNFSFDYSDALAFFMGIFFLLAVLELAVGIVSAIVRFRLFGFITIKNDTEYMNHLFHLPEKFFFQRDVGDLQQRKQANSTISETMINLVIPLALNIAMMIVYAFVMFRYDFRMAIVGIVTLVINMALANYSSFKRLNISRVMRTDFGKFYSSTIGTISMMETIKASGAENSSFSAWTENQYRVVEGKFQYKKVTNRIKNLIVLVNTISSGVALGVGCFLIVRGDFTIGMMMAFQGIFSGFIAPMGQLIDSGQLLNEMTTDIERVDDVMNYPEYHPFAEEISKEQDYGKLKGHIELKNVTFGYSPLEEPLIKELNIDIKPGSRIAFVGKSGCGKSTIASLISGMYEPWSGEITYDGKSLKEIPEKVFRESLSMVNQNIILFKDTIENNIKMWNPLVENYEMVLAARDACITDEIMEKPGGFVHVIKDNGADFSGGERQRIEIARAFAVNPSVMIMDEATSALDAITEHKIVEALKAQGITCIIIAHRLSTIRDCDEIIVLENGSVKERGTHEELIRLNGCYKELVSGM